MQSGFFAFPLPPRGMMIKVANELGIDLYDLIYVKRNFIYEDLYVLGMRDSHHRQRVMNSPNFEDLLSCFDTQSKTPKLKKNLFASVKGVVCCRWSFSLRGSLF